MPVYVDPLINWGSSDGVPACFDGVPSCHMYADTLTELIKMAGMLGMKRNWIQLQHKEFPHFDLTEGKRRQAVKSGAVEQSCEEMVEFVKEKRLKLSGI